MTRRWVRKVDAVESGGSERAGKSWVAPLHVLECSFGGNVGTARTLNRSGYSIRLAFPASRHSNRVSGVSGRSVSHRRTLPRVLTGHPYSSGCFAPFSQRLGTRPELTA